jgi:hypothetical protein
VELVEVDAVRAETPETAVERPFQSGGPVVLWREFRRHDDALA